MVISEALKAIKAITPYKCPHLVVVWLVEWVKGCDWLMGLFSGGEGVKKQPMIQRYFSLRPAKSPGSCDLNLAVGRRYGGGRLPLSLSTTQNYWHYYGESGSET